MIKSIALVTNSAAGVNYALNGGEPYYIEVASFKTRGGGIMLLDGSFDDILTEDVPYGLWTINGVTGFASVAEVAEALVKAGVRSSYAISDLGICNNCVDAVLSDTEDLPNPGWIQPKLLAGNIKVTDVGGNTSTIPFDKNEASLFRVKRVWLTGTTAAMGIKVIY